MSNLEKKQTNLAHICIVSDRIVPNLIPVKMDKPQYVMLIASNSMEQRGVLQRFQKILEHDGFLVEVYTELPSAGMDKITEYASNWFLDADEKYPEMQWILNITGGNKLMTLAFYNALAGSMQRIIYTDSRHNHLEIVPQDAEKHSPEQLLPVLDIPGYLAAQGFVYRNSAGDANDWQERVRQRKQLTKYLGKHSGSIGDFIGAINGMAQDALNRNGTELKEPVQFFDRRPQGRWKKVIEEIAKTELIFWEESALLLEFKDAEAARYLGGGWLEEFAWHQVADCQPDDVRMGVEGTWDSKGARNELDLLVVHHNRLLMIECKTLKLSRDAKEDDQMLYKLDSLGDDLKGLFGEVLLMTARRPGTTVLGRARQHRIQVVDATGFASFQADIREWMKTGRYPRKS